MPLVVMIFVLGIANFAMHKAVLESGHPLVGQMPALVPAQIRRPRISHAARALTDV